MKRSEKASPTAEPPPLQGATAKVWSGRIATATDPELERLNVSFPEDLALVAADVAVNRAWAAELVSIGILSADQCATIDAQLALIEADARRGTLQPLPGDEDVHTFIERRLTESLGELGERIHTGRSRNDQVATDLRLWLKDALGRVDAAVRRLEEALLARARAGERVSFAAWTHLQPAQVTSLAHYFLSFIFALDRDRERLADAAMRADRCPLGSGAVAGSAFSVDRRRLATALGFGAPTENSLDAVGDRDGLQEAGAALAVLAGHLSRLAGDLIFLSTSAMGVIRLADAFTTGSSMMPQKKNPDGCELVRAKAARAAGHVTALLSLTHGLPSSYHKDLQEAKQPLMALVADALLSLSVMSGCIGTMEIDSARLETLAADEMLYATDIADELTRRGIPFRKAHAAVGTLVRRALETGKPLRAATALERAAASPLLDLEIAPLLNAAASRARREVEGGAGPAAVAAALELARSRIARAWPLASPGGAQETGAAGGTCAPSAPAGVAYRATGAAAGAAGMAGPAPSSGAAAAVRRGAEPGARGGPAPTDAFPRLPAIEPSDATRAILAREDRYQLTTYKKMPIALTRGEGVWVWDSDGRRYLDLYGGHAVALTGHCHPRVVAAIQEQSQRLMFYSNVVYSDVRSEAVELLARLAPQGLGHVFLCNSGTEANETAIKIARKYTGRPNVVSLEEGFHGRTMGSLSATGIARYRALVPATVPGHAFVPFGDLEAMRRQVDERTAAIILEPLPSMAGVLVADPSYYRGLVRLGAETGALLVFDEVQTGLGRTGRLFAGEHFDVVPDMITLAKGLASGYPTGAVLVTERVAGTVKVGEQGTTFGGGPLAAAAMKATLETIEAEHLVESAAKVGTLLAGHLSQSHGVRAVRGLGLLIGITMERAVAPVLGELAARGILAGGAENPHVIRLLPPLVLTSDQALQFVATLEEVETCLSRAATS